MTKIVIFTGDLAYSVRKGIVALLDDLHDAEFLLVVHQPSKTLWQLVLSQWRNLKRNGWRWIPYQFGDAVTRARGRWSRAQRTLPGSVPGARFAAEAIAREPRAHMLYTANIHSRPTLECVQGFAPDLGISLAAPILAAELFSIPRLGTVNLHKGKVPDYRGMPPAFWELWRGEKEIGCTVHMVERALDAGAVVCEATIPVRPHSTLKGLQLTLDELGIRLMTTAAGAVLAGKVQFKPQRAGGQTNRKPTLSQERALRKRMAPLDSDGARALAKGAFFRGYSGLMGALPRRLRTWRGNQRIVVLLYHRVNDDMRDSLTVGIEQFDAQMALLARHCRLVDIRDVVAGRVARDSALPVVAVSFDDGYLDNYENATPILLRHAVPAAFFVATGKIGVDGPFEHDLRKIGRGLPTMTWHQLREMHAAGFAIGSHSVSHLDCGRADIDQVRAELRESRATLARELGIDAPIFAYPYGGRQNMTSQALQIVREEGYVGCLSAYGGRNDGPLDPFDVRRVGINHHFTASSFRARLEGWF